jgi:predicted lipoprotein with Yx(FWY)xxD motif
MTRRSLSWLTAFALLLLAGVLTGFALAGPILKSAPNKTLGKNIVVNAKGLTLYHLTSERAGKIQCSGICATFWIPVLAPAKGKPALGKGVIRSKVGTIKRPDGKVQLTYNGYALYRYYLDKKPGQTGGEGFATGTGNWYALSTAGALVKPKKGSSTSTTPSTPTSTGYGY